MSRVVYEKYVCQDKWVSISGGGGVAFLWHPLASQAHTYPCSSNWHYTWHFQMGGVICRWAKTHTQIDTTLDWL